MNKIAAIAVMVLFGVSVAGASNYPGNYYNQTVRVASAGPAIVAGVSGGSMGNKFMIGYKRSGFLGGYDSLTAVVRTTYSSYSGGVRTTERTIQVGKEWQGTGFLTPAMSLSELTGDSDARELRKIELAFVAGVQWDSNYGANFTVTKDDLAYNSPSFSTSSDADCWNFVVDQMRK